MFLEFKDQATSQSSGRAGLIKDKVDDSHLLFEDRDGDTREVLSRWLENWHDENSYAVQEESLDFDDAEEAIF